MYALPPTSNKRATTFGYGTKVDFSISNNSPPPGSYTAQSDFEKKDFKNTSSLHLGREQITFGSFIL